MGPSIRVSAFRSVPPFAQGLVRDLRVRWALEEAGLPYEERLIGPEDQSPKLPGAAAVRAGAGLEEGGCGCSNSARSSSTSASGPRR